jgi:hypothetical protein
MLQRWTAAKWRILDKPRVNKAALQKFFKMEMLQNIAPSKILKMSPSARRAGKFAGHLLRGDMPLSAVKSASNPTDSVRMRLLLIFVVCAWL